MKKINFALVSADPSHGNRFWIDPETGDATSFYNWISVWGGTHFNFDRLLADGFDILRSFDIVMMSGHPNHLVTILKIAEFLKPTRTVTMFYPEGSLRLYDGSINDFHPEVYDAWRACDIISSAEEDKIPYYEAFVGHETIVRFIHVPLRTEMEAGNFVIPLIHKDRNAAFVYGDNNPNHPLVAIACAARLKMDVTAFDIDRGKLTDIKRLFPNTRFRVFSKLGQYPFLRIIGRCFVHFYPTEWIGTAREQIACAAAGVPCIGNQESHTQRHLFPGLATPIYDIDRICELTKRLKSDDRYYNDIVKRAFAGLGFYGINATKDRFLSAYNDALKMKDKVLVPV